MQTDIKPIKLITIIVNRTRGKKIIAMLNEKKYGLHYAFLGMGTAPSELKHYFGLSEPEKTVVVLIADQEHVEDIFATLKDKFQIGAGGDGIAFSIAINSASNLQALQFIIGLNRGEDTPQE